MYSIFSPLPSSPILPPPQKKKKNSFYYSNYYYQAYLSSLSILHLINSKTFNYNQLLISFFI